MLPKNITSLQHPLVSHWNFLRKERPVREQEKQVLITGETLVRELADQIVALISTDEKPILRAKEHFIVTPEILKKITGLEQPDGVAAIAKLPEPQNLREKNAILVLDQLADPGNVGTLIRTALAFGWEGVITTPGTVDLFNDKALRAARGATFRLPYMQMSQEELTQTVQGKNPLLADTEGTSLDEVARVPPAVLILSSEAHGPQSWTRGIRKVSIPMRGIESLNVGVAGAILLYSLRPFS